MERGIPEVKILVACECSGKVRDALIARGHEAWSCDLVPSDRPGPHIQDDVTKYLHLSWDMIVAFPPCTDLCVSGARWFPEKIADGRQRRSINFFLQFTMTNCPRVAIENPVGIMSSHYRKPDQIVQPWQFGHPETKATCLWLHGLPKLTPTATVEPDYMRKPDGTYYTDAGGSRYSKVHFLSRSNPDRAKIRSETYQGIADAIADQWG